MTESRIARYRILALLIVSLGVMPGISRGQTDTLDIAAVTEYLSEGNAEALMLHASEHLELALLEQPHRYTRSQALYILKKFFRQYPSDGFEVGHSMIQGEEWWLIGRYALRDEEQFLRFYLRFDGSSPMYVLKAVQVIRS